MNKIVAYASKLMNYYTFAAQIDLNKKITMHKPPKSLVPWIGKTGKMLEIILNERFSQAGLNLTKTQCLFLGKLHKKNGRLQKELAFITGRDKTSLGRLVTTMEKKGLIIRKSMESDKRAKQIFLTDAGRKLYSDAMPVIESTIDEIQQGIPQETLDEVIQVLKKIQSNINNMDTDGVAKLPPTCS